MTEPAIAGFTKPVQTRMEPENYRWLKLESAKQERSINFLVNQAIANARRAAEVKEIAQ